MSMNLRVRYVILFKSVFKFDYSMDIKNANELIFKKMYWENT